MYRPGMVGVHARSPLSVELVILFALSHLSAAWTQTCSPYHSIEKRRPGRYPPNNSKELKSMIAQQPAPKYEGSPLWTREEISDLVSHSGNAAETLTNVVQLIQQRFKTDVCSVYLLEPDRSN